MELFLDTLRESEVLLIAGWRNKHRVGLRTSTLTTTAGQSKFYQDVVLNPLSPHRYWAVRDSPAINPQRPMCRAMVGLTDISWENGSAEISLITDGKPGVGRKAVHLVLAEAFDNMRLLTVYGECFHTNPALLFWRKMVEERGANGGQVTLPRRKFWDGDLHSSMYFYFAKSRWGKWDSQQTT